MAQNKNVCYALRGFGTNFREKAFSSSKLTEMPQNSSKGGPASLASPSRSKHGVIALAYFLAPAPEDYARYRPWRSATSC